jgi:hypothetical protein
MATAKTEVLTALEVNALTGETVERPLTADELADRKEMQKTAAAQAAEAKAKADARTSALAKLSELGLTAEEIAAL